VDVSGAREADEEEVLIGEAQTHFTARVNPETSAKAGASRRLAVDPSRFHYFDPVTGARLAGTAAPILAPA
jgi:hypothetical protein